MTGERWAAAATAPMTESFPLFRLTTQALVAEVNAARLRACEVEGSLAETRLTEEE